MTPKATADEHLLRACVRDLVALSVTPAWWIGRRVPAIMDGLRDMLGHMLRADAVYIRVRDVYSPTPHVSVIGASAEAMERALRPEPTRPAYTSFARPAPSVSRFASSCAPMPVRLPVGSV